MNNTTLVAATLLAFTLAGCAATNGGNGATAPVAVAAGSTMYCMDGKLNEDDRGYRCTWAKTMKEACDSTTITVIAKNAIATGPTRGGMCAHGDRIVHVTTR